MTHILLVDDEPDLLILEKKILEKKYGFDIETANSGKEALEKYASMPFDAIVSDVSMPEMDGLTLLKTIRSKDKNIPFIVFTVRGREEVAIEALNQGASFYVQKEETPKVAFAELAHKIIKSVELVQAERNLRIQRDLAISCANAKNLREILGYCANAAIDASQMNGVAFYLMDEGHLNLFFEKGLTQAYKTNIVQSTLTPVLYATMRSPEGIYRDSNLLQSESQIFFDEEKGKSDAIIPMRHHGKEIGLIHLISHTENRIVSSSYKQFAEDVIYQIAGHISDRLAEDALLESERKLEALIRNLPGMVYIGSLDDKRTMEFVSNGSLALTGYSANDLTENNISYGTVIHPSDAPKVQSVIYRAVEKHVQFRIQYRIQTREGKYKWVWEQGTGVYDSAGNPIGLEGFIIDITRQKILDDQVKLSRNRLNMLFSHMNSGCVIFAGREPEGDHILIDMNIAAEKIEGKKREDIIGIPFSGYFQGHAEKVIQDAFLGILHDTNPRTLERIPHDTPNGRRWLDIYIFSSVPGSTQEFFVIYSDVTGRIEDEEKIISSLHEKETLLKEVHHRVKNNLQIISGILKLQSYRTTDPDAQEIIQECRNQVYSMASIHELLYNSRDIGMIKVTDYVEKLLEHLQQEYGSVTSQISFITEIDQEIVLDIERCIPCGLILNELITNAVKYAFEPGGTGEIKVSFTLKDHMFEMRVVDNGKGIPHDLDLSKSRTLGTELISRLARQLKGKIHMGPGPGTDIVVVFPELSGNEGKI